MIEKLRSDIKIVDKNYLFAEVKDKLDVEYRSLSFEYRYLDYDKSEWDELLLKFANSKVKITFEEDDGVK